MANIVKVRLNGVKQFRRAGIEFTLDNTPYDLDLDKLTKEQVDELYATPTLRVNDGAPRERDASRDTPQGYPKDPTPNASGHQPPPPPPTGKGKESGK